MSHEPTAFHAPIVLGDHRATRKVRAGSAVEDFTFGQAVKKHGPHIETPDERNERLMNRLEPVGAPLRRQVLLGIAIWLGAPLFLCGAAAAIYLHFFN